MNQRIIRLALATALIAFTSLAQAQWMWVNDKGVKQFSDQPPPPGTPANRILKGPRGAAVAELRKDTAEAPANGEEAAEGNEKATPAKPTLAERNADFKKRQQETAEKTAKANEDAKREAEKKKYCAEAKSNIGTLESGARIAETGPNGERNFMSDEARAQKIKEQRESVNSICK
ncbi:MULTISPECIES: DUF4124 domain-containing protein [unclassified Duganella]|uniref:DUF4124 domain-containing protein n=1 Tax=unclassified Duganella TaxID=2636909 RepID=UPI0006F7805A|nr:MULTISPECIES: DUF4124 domain-containing protein [unclassified Duganella]KQV61569.1 hypothetical protein ASD07_01600 [Duganella sp. Root336D2]KRB84077.1 hypothetical protein ASE26_08265 [Duganella sp. Root198D2]